MSFCTLNSFIPKVLPKLGWQVLLLNNWHDIIGNLKEHMRLERVYNNILIIGVYESHWMQELYMLSNTIIDKVNNYLKANHIGQIRFKLVNKNSSTKLNLKSNNNLTQEKFKMRELLNSEQIYINNLVYKIKNIELRESLGKFFARCATRD